MRKPMNYRVYFLNPSGRIEAAEDVAADNDTAALEAIEASAAGRPAEIWQGIRLVKRLGVSECA